MRILQVIAGAEHGGAETFFGDFMLSMRRAEQAGSGAVQKAVLRPYEARLERLEKAGIPVTTFPFGGWFDWRTRHGLAEQIKNFKPHIVQTWMNRATKFMPPRTAQQPYIHVGWLGGYYDMKYYQACDHIVVLTEDMRRHVLQSGWPAERVHIVPPFAPDKTAEPIDRARLDTPKNAPLILALARLHPVKGLDILIRAMRDVPNAYLWIAGEGELRKTLMELTVEMGVDDRVRFLGWRHDREALLRTADLCAFPSRYDSFGVVTLEAWAQGCPLVAAAAQGPKSVITTGHDGIVVPIDDIGALSGAMRMVLAEKPLREKLIQNGRRTYDTLYSEKSVTERYLALYREIALRGSYACEQKAA